MVKRFVKAHGLVHQMGSHKSQRHPSETMGEALDFIQVTRPKLTLPCHHQDYILNMDQTPVPSVYYIQFNLLKYKYEPTEYNNT